MNESNKTLRSLLRVLRNAGVHKFQSPQFAIEFGPDPDVEQVEAGTPSAQAYDQPKQFKDFDPNSADDLDVLLGANR